MDPSGEHGFDVLMNGRLFCDLTFTFADRDRLPELGEEVLASAFAVNPGGIYNVAAALSSLGIRAGIQSQLGSDLFSRFIGERMRDDGLRADLINWIDVPLPVVSVGISLPRDRTFITYVEEREESHPYPRLSVAELERYRPRMIFTHGGIGTALARAARERGILVLLDAFWSPETLRSAEYHDFLREVDVFSPNLAEAREMTGAADAASALEMLSRLCDCVVIKCGEQGALACCYGERLSVPAIPVQAVDTTGAGDNFNAGLIYGMLRGYPLERTLQCANIAGGLSTRSMGGSAPVSQSELEAWLIRLNGSPPHHLEPQAQTG